MNSLSFFDITITGAISTTVPASSLSLVKTPLPFFPVFLINMDVEIKLIAFTPKIWHKLILLFRIEQKPALILPHVIGSLAGTI